jgi:hypothetical protein
MKDAIKQLEGCRARYKARNKGIGEPLVTIPLEHLGVLDGAAEPIVFISIKDLIALVRSMLSK